MNNVVFINGTVTFDLFFFSSKKCILFLKVGALELILENNFLYHINPLIILAMNIKSFTLIKHSCNANIW